MMSVPTKKNHITLGSPTGSQETVDLKNIWINLKKIWDKKTETFLLPLPNGVSVRLSGVLDDGEKIKFKIGEDEYKEIRNEEAWINYGHIEMSPEGHASINFGKLRAEMSRSGYSKKMDKLMELVQ